MEYTPDRTNASIGRLSSFTLNELEGIVKQYPWFSLARREVFLRMALLGDEYRKEAVKKAAVYLFTREGLLKDQKIASSVNEIALNPEKDKEGFTFEIEKEETVQEEAPRQPQPRFHVIGGDYFGKQDFDTLKGDGLTAIERIRQAPPALVEEAEMEKGKVSQDFNDEMFYTETLAKIYTQQEFYDRAIEIYSKLILLYPEKNTYFAALIEELKKHL